MALSTDGIALRLNDCDNVAVCLRRVAAGGRVAFEDGVAVTAAREIPPGHKIALRAIAKGEPVVKYGQTMGRASEPIAAGEHAHVQNIEGIRGRGDLAGVS